MCDHRVRHVPPFPAGTHRAVLEVDVLSVEPEALVEAVELLEHRAPQEQKPSEHPVALNGLQRHRLVEVVVATLRHDAT